MGKKKKREPEPLETSSTPPPPETPRNDASAVFTGDRLKSAREERGLSLREISDKTKISVATLQALEEERYEDMPNARVYVRGFVRCLAEEVGLDRDQVCQTYVPRWERWFTGNGQLT